MKKNPSTLISMRKKTSGQNVIEYLLVTAVVVLVCLVFFHPASGPAKKAMENVLEQTVSTLNAMKNEIQF